MLVIHGLWSSASRLMIWAEDPAPPPRRRRDDRHPFAASHGRLREIGLVGRRAEARLCLPTRAGSPLASPLLPAELPRSRGRPTLGAWRVPAIAMDPLAAADLLLGDRDFRAADSVRWLAHACEMTIGMIARGRVLPKLVGGVPRWSPVPAPDDTARLGALAESMPAACRAELVADDPEGRAPAAIVSDLVSTLVDAVARDALHGRPLPIRGRTPTPNRGQTPTAAEAFLAALASRKPDKLDAPALEAAIDEWHASGTRRSGPVRTCFRLAEPNVENGSWRVELFLQSIADPSLLVPAADVWRSGRVLAVVGEAVADPHERFLADLGHATRLYPELEGALDQPRPAELVTDATGAHRFLREVAPLLEQAGFGVIVPSWWGRRSARLGLKMHATTRRERGESSGVLGLRSLARFNYEVALGEETLSERDLRALARMKAPLVKVRGQWVELAAADVERALELLARQRHEPQGEATVAELLRVGLGLEGSREGLPVLEVEADGWLGALLGGGEDRRLEAICVPRALEGTLRAYQERGLGWLVFLDSLGLGACLADDMGLGKTVQLLALLLAEREPAGRKRLAPTLLVCPMSLVGNWQREAAKFAPSLRVHVHHGAGRTSGAAFARGARRADLVLTTFGLVARDREVLAKVAWERVVLDEAQNVKNASSRQAQAVRSLPSARRVALTGTPMENRLSELWSIMEFLNPGLLGSAKVFRERFSIPIERYHDEEAAATLRRVTRPFVLRRMKTDRSIIADLPDKIEMNVFCNLTREQATLYQAVVDDMLTKIDEAEGIERRGLVLATLTKLKQVCNHPAHFLGDGSRLGERSGKLENLEETLEEVMAAGERALVFTQYAEMGHLIQMHLRERLGVAADFLHGGVRKRGRDEMVSRFQTDDGAPVFLLSLKAGGVGLNLTSASHVVHFDRWWNPAVEDQATDRAFRIGQKRNVQVRKLVCVGTLEERIDELIASKRDLAERIVGTGEAWLTELSTAQIRELVSLGADAVAEA